MQPQNLPQQSLTEHDTTTHADTLSGGGMLLRSWSPSLWVQTHLIQKYRSGLCGNRHNTERLELCRLCLLTMPTEPPSFCRGYGLGLRIQALQMKRPDHMWRKMTSRSVLYIYIYVCNHVCPFNHTIPVDGGDIPCTQANLSVSPNVASSQIYWIVNQYQYTDIALVHSILYIIKTHPIIWCCSIQIVLHAYMPHTVLSSQWISSCKLNIAESWNCISHLSHLFILMGFLMHVSVSGPVPTSWGFHPGPFVKTCWAWPPLPQPRKRATKPTFRDICDN